MSIIETHVNERNPHYPVVSSILNESIVEDDMNSSDDAQLVSSRKPRDRLVAHFLFLNLNALAMGDM